MAIASTVHLSPVTCHLSPVTCRLSPGRLVSSIGLQAPEGSVLTVAGESRPWTEGAFEVFDDSFVHSVTNPTDTYRIVLAFVTWHPGLLGKAEASSPPGHPSGGGETQTPPNSAAAESEDRDRGEL